MYKHETPFENSVCGSSSKAALANPSRLKMKPDVVLRRLAIAVASNDHSYMPQLVSVAVGKNRRSLQEIRDIRIPSNVTGYVALLENANITHPCESISSYSGNPFVSKATGMVNSVTGH
jgi:hypothetical protein